jgi:UPF0755 protein
MQKQRIIGNTTLMGLVLTLVIAMVMAGVSGLFVMQRFKAFSEAPLPITEPMVLSLAPGSPFQLLPRHLAALGLAKDHWHWRWYGRIHRPSLRAGEYWVEPGTSVAELVQQLVSGQVRRHRLTIIEGWTVADLRARLAADVRLKPLSLDWDEAELMTHLGCEGCWAEGRFLPETYTFIRPFSDLDLLALAHTAMRAALEQAWAQRQADLPLSSPDELLIMASLIEKEARLASERAEISGVFARRLHLGMRLQTDPTVVYGLNEAGFDGRIRRVHLRSDHPWNTYTRHGLPATPIALPGRASIDAAAQPAAGRSLYFVARGDGSHHFSESLAEHNRAVDRYIRGRP